MAAPGPAVGPGEADHSGDRAVRPAARTALVLAMVPAGGRDGRFLVGQPGEQHHVPVSG
ncbi:hypothetical protein [Actinomadura sp. DC4]|uniref:hypothetical protein n=1 Tax=Actinomadura sp. DC4 TaxID=3055069 RepID=UPI0025B1FB92|nr:hypothetical protein [Actinomadura sp. DC4]MDN3353134.1 hypothetical protein [Actinomadura sp. DC4]